MKENIKWIIKVRDEINMSPSRLKAFKDE